MKDAGLRATDCKFSLDVNHPRYLLTHGYTQLASMSDASGIVLHPSIFYHFDGHCQV